jgi:hypothetical protein
LSAGLGLSGVEVLAIVVGLLLGGITKGLIGIALPIIAVTVMMSVIDPHRAIGIMVLPILATNLWLALHQGRAALAEPWRRFWPLTVACLLTMLVTATLATAFAERLILFTLGVVLVLFVVMTRLSPRLVLAPAWVCPAGVAAGIFAGLIGGATSIYGPPINIYFVALRLEKGMWLRSIGLTYSLCGLPLLIGYGLNGILDGATALLSALACLPAFLGTWIGLRLHKRVSAATFQKLVLAALFLAGLNFLRRALM